MSTDRITRTWIWKSTLESRENDDFKAHRDLLRLNFLNLRDKTSDIVNMIALSVPELTIHDTSHLDGLWETASLICGNDYQINPLEAFVLGGAILMHDAALCYEAYDNGIEGIRNTVTWKDAYASLAETESDESRIKLSDFSTLRALHASQAIILAERSWKSPDSENQIYLIDDSTLRIHLAELIGKIASSHHWDLDKILSLGSQINPIQGFPKEWKINPIKIACILRCADAAHICGDRAPDFLFALIKRTGISFEHWQGQNRLAGPTVDSTDLTQSTLIYTSTKPFREQESKAWWIAFDLIMLVDQEIKACNDLLISHFDETLQFKIKSIKGAQSINQLKDYVQVNGWLPIDSKIHVGNIEKLVSNLGGEQLYGCDTMQKKIEVALRELIQNSRDSIQARIHIDSDFTGKILIKCEKTDQGYLLTVEDNGVGMSQRVLTGTLLDFGSSFWSSSLVQSEFPGLVSSAFKPVGRFGIGFYAIFMVADKVSVTTKLWNEGLGSTRQLIFDNGISLRPLFKLGAPDNFKFSVNCRVQLLLKNGAMNEEMYFETNAHSIHKSNLKVPMEDYLARLCAGLDVDVYFLRDKTENKIHTDISSPTFNVKEWLHKISLSSIQSDTRVKDLIDREYENIRFIKEKEKIVGIASFHLSQIDFIGLQTIGGMAINPLIHSHQGHMGFMEVAPLSARRDSGEVIASPEILKNWAVEQLNLTNLQEGQIYELARLVDMLCFYRIDPTSYAKIIIKRKDGHIFLDFQSLVYNSFTRSISFFILPHFNFTDSNVIPDTFEDSLIVYPITRGSMFNYDFEDNIPVVGFNIYSLLHEAIICAGKTPIWSRRPTNIPSLTYGENVDVVTLNVVD